MFDINSYSNQFSNEILEYFQSIKTPDNEKWIEAYFKILLDPSNINSNKLHKHHIKPCFTFKDNKHDNRQKTLLRANKLNGNIINLSVYNHIMAHYYLWKILNNIDSKIAFQYMIKQKKYINELTEDQIQCFAKRIEDCAKENKTANIKEYMRIYDKNRKGKRKEKQKEYVKRYYNNNREKEIKRSTEYNNMHKENRKEYNKLYRELNKEREQKRLKEKQNQMCYDPIKNDYLTYNTLSARMRIHRELYQNISLKECIISYTSLPSK